MPSTPGIIDYDDDGYFDLAYIGDVNGNMWRIDLTPDAVTGRGVLQSANQLSGYQPFLLFNGCGTATGAGPCVDGTGTSTVKPIFFEPAIIFVGGSTAPPTLGVAFGTGNRAELARPNTVDPELLLRPRQRPDRVDLPRARRPEASSRISATSRREAVWVRARCRSIPRVAPTLPAAPRRASSSTSARPNEKTTSTVYSTQGYLSLVTFTPDSVTPCATNGSSFQYRFFFLTGTGYYGQTGNYADFRQSLGEGIATIGQSTSIGGIHDMVFYSGNPDVGFQDNFTKGVVRTIQQNWKEQQ